MANVDNYAVTSTKNIRFGFAESDVRFHVAIVAKTLLLEEHCLSCSYKISRWKLFFKYRDYACTVKFENSSKFEFQLFSTR